ncbi:MAG: SCO family protein [Anaerolineae bacterium]|nr:SCO family protein [Phycisphaerae bacterium]
MGRTQKIFTTGLWAVVVIGMIALVATRAFPPREEEAKAERAVSSEKFAPLYDTPAFEFTDQNGKTFAKTDLMGKVWIADFIFTHCGGPCPIMTSKLANVQKQVARPDVKLVSFSVDPERDTPAVLKEYAKSYGADESRWSFLTGPKPAMYETAAAMKITAVPATADMPIIHSDLFLLVDRAGQVVGVYHSNDDDKMKQLIADATELADRK